MVSGKSCVQNKALEKHLLNRYLEIFAFILRVISAPLSELDTLFGHYLYIVRTSCYWISQLLASGLNRGIFKFKEARVGWDITWYLET